MSNFKKRVISSVVGGGLMIGLLVIGKEILLAALCAVSLVGYFELTKACSVHEEGKKINGLETAGVLFTLIWYAVIELSDRNVIAVDKLTVGFILLVLSLMIFMAVYVLTFPRFNADQAMAAYFSFIYCPVMISFTYMTRALNMGIYLVWMIFVCSWFCDIFAYLVGVKFGKHKFVPKLSPKKTVEGAVGGVAGAALTGGLYAGFVLAPRAAGRSTGEVIAVIVVISMLGAMISMVGDLAASAIKRNHDIKDYGKLIPGHGGIMDRFDSVIIVAPLVYILSVLFLNYIGA